MANEHPHHPAAAHGHPPPNIKLYISIFVALMFLTVLTVLVSYWHLPPAGAITVDLLIAGFKASLVLAFFMHLKGEHKLIWAFLGIMLFCCIGFLIVPLDQHLISDRSTHTNVEAERVAAEKASEQPDGATHEMPQGEHVKPQTQEAK